MKRLFQPLGNLHFSVLGLLTAILLGVLETMALARSRCQDAWRDLGML